jgi:hypothetical protein
MERFIEEIIRDSRVRSGRPGTTTTFVDPQIVRSDGLAFPVSADAIRIAHTLAAAERASSKEASAQFSANTYGRLSLVALGDTIAHLKDLTAGPMKRLWLEQDSQRSLWRRRG